MAIDQETGEVTEEERHVRPFGDFLNEHRHGALHAEVSDALNELVQAVVGIGRAGSLTVTINIKPAGSTHEQVFVGDDVKLKLPSPDREEAICFVDADANLTRRDPRQPELPGLRSVEARVPATQAKDVATS
jgi:hypothetical protein